MDQFNSSNQLTASVEEMLIQLDAKYEGEIEELQNTIQYLRNQQHHIRSLLVGMSSKPNPHFKFPKQYLAPEPVSNYSTKPLIIPSGVGNAISAKESKSEIFEEDKEKEYPKAKIKKKPGGGLDAPMLPQFKGMSRYRAIVQVFERFEEYVHTNIIVRELYGIIEDPKIAATMRDRVSTAIHTLKERQEVVADPDNKGFHKINRP
jgi:hypothetical protein